MIEELEKTPENTYNQSALCCLLGEKKIAKSIQSVMFPISFSLSLKGPFSPCRFIIEGASVMLTKDAAKCF